MKRAVVLTLAFGMVVSASMAAFCVSMTGNVSGALTINYAVPAYTDQVGAWSKDLDFTINYGPTAVDHTFDINDTFNYTTAGCAGMSPVPGVPDWVYALTTDPTTGDWVFHDVNAEKKYNQYLPGSVHAVDSIDFASGAVYIYNYTAMTGDRAIQHEVGRTGTFICRLQEYVTNANQIVKLETVGTLGGDVTFDGKGGYSPPVADVYLSNAGGFSLTGDFKGAVITFTGGLYDVLHTGPKGGVYKFAIDNP